LAAIVLANTMVWIVLELVCFGILSLIQVNEVVHDPNDTDHWAAHAKGSFLGGLYQWDEHCLWRMQPHYVGDESEQRFWGKTGLRVNEHGMRSPSVPRTKPSHVRRVMVLGGSHPMGMYVNEDEVYSAVLERLLRKHTGEEWQVLNASVPGHTSFQGLQYLTHHGLAFEPDIVIHDLGVNDTLPLNKDFPKPDHEVDQPPEWAVDTRSALEYSAVYRLIRGLVQTSTDVDVAGQRVPLEQHTKNVESLLSLGKQHNVQVLLLSQLSVSHGQSGLVQCVFPEKDHNAMADICGLFSSHGNKAGDFFVDPVHANAEGHAMIAQTIVDKLMALQWITAASP